MTFAYCERLDPGSWAEPINALTNLAFVIAAIAAWRLYRERAESPQWDILVLIGLVTLIGAGSFLWHTTATDWAELADIIPIWLYVNVFLVSFLIRIAGASFGVAAVVWLGFQLFDYGTRSLLPAELCNGSVVYFPTFAALVAASAYARYVRHPASAFLLGGAALLAVSLVFRSMDNGVCEALPIGTHFVWHLCNGGLLYLLLRAMITTVPTRTAA